MTLGIREDGWTHERAEQELEAVRADVRRGIWKPPTRGAVRKPNVEPSIHVLASEYVERRRCDPEIDVRTIEHQEWALSGHLLEPFGDLKPSEVTVRHVKDYIAAKQAERKERQAGIEAWRTADPAKRGRMPRTGLSNASINKTTKVLAQVLDEAIDAEWIKENVARGKKRRAKVDKPKRTWLELDQVQALLAAAMKHRALIATMILAGLRVGELCSLRWRDLDLAGGRLRVEDAKTVAGVRSIDVSPMLLDELKLHKAEACDPEPDAFVFATVKGTARNRSNITRQILQPAIERANVELAKAGRTPIDGVTNHSLRRTFCALVYEAGASPAYVMAQMGHTDASLALEIYSKVMERKRDTGERMDALVRGADWAEVGRSAAPEVEPLPVAATKNPVSGAF
jgi:integrase